MPKPRKNVTPVSHLATTAKIVWDTAQTLWLKGRCQMTQNSRIQHNSPGHEISVGSGVFWELDFVLVSFGQQELLSDLSRQETLPQMSYCHSAGTDRDKISLVRNKHANDTAVRPCIYYSECAVSLTGKSISALLGKFPVWDSHTQLQFIISPKQGVYKCFSINKAKPWKSCSLSNIKFWTIFKPEAKPKANTFAVSII